MYYYVSGTVEHVEPYLAVIDCSGVGYAVKTSAVTLGSIKKGEKARLYTHLHVREDVLELYGFSTQGELNLFRQLISISGVGPKAALSILSASTTQTLVMSVVTGDEKALTAAPGIGKKLAQRIILELKGKLEKDQTLDVSAAVPYVSEDPGALNTVQEATAALSVLGYSSSEISAAMKGLDIKNMTLEQIIKEALKNTLRQ
ncbi:MAG: Holliday junction branch migration protein RuvA [Oscillospiraceae bacterium]|nr:Holliday junction branch migration protein RuvA [Oscillospiraceae bacterium]